TSPTKWSEHEVARATLSGARAARDRRSSRRFKGALSRGSNDGTGSSRSAAEPPPKIGGKPAASNRARLIFQRAFGALSRMQIMRLQSKVSSEARPQDVVVIYLSR